MVGGRKRRDHNLIDAIEAVEPSSFSDDVWRVVRDGQEPTQCSSSGGRWDDVSFEVLYTSATRAGAVRELKFHVMEGQPVFPSRVSYRLYELNVTLDRVLKLIDLSALAAIGLDTGRFGQLSYQEKNAEYPRSQDIGEVAHFLDHDGLIVPSARHQAQNVIVFCNAVPPAAVRIKADHGPVDWDT